MSDRAGGPLQAACVVVAAVEIMAPHAVGADKVARLEVPFVELDASRVIRPPHTWVPIQDRFKPFRCSDCATSWPALQAGVDSIGKLTNVALPGSPYICAPWRCYRCREPMLLFTWLEDGQAAMWSARPPDRVGVPRTLQRRFSSMVGGKCLANTCPDCHAMQQLPPRRTRRTVFGVRMHR